MQRRTFITLLGGVAACAFMGFDLERTSEADGNSSSKPCEMIAFAHSPGRLP